MYNYHKILNANKMKLRRRDLRIKSTESEKKLWAQIRNNKLGFRFKRQYSIGNYVVDFYCHKARLAIEVDGSIHLRSKSYDEYRTKYLNTLGIKEIRFKNATIKQTITDVVLEIIKSLPSPEVLPLVVPVS